MKKIVSLAAVCLFFANFGLAQNNYQPGAGHFSTEFNIVPFSNNAPLSIDYLHFRYFINSHFAARLGINVLTKNNNTWGLATTATNMNSLEDKKTSTQMGFYPGIEYHFNMMERFSPYVGVEYHYMTKSSHESQDVMVGSGTTATIGQNVTRGAWADNSEKAFSEIGGKLFAGADFYVLPHLFLGAEMGITYLSTTYNEVTYAAPAANVVVRAGRNNVSGISINISPAFRLGFYL